MKLKISSDSEIKKNDENENNDINDFGEMLCFHKLIFR